MFNAKYKDLKNKTVVVAGANGLLGKKCVDGFLYQGSLVLGIDNNFKDSIENEFFIKINCDLSDVNQTAKIIKQVINNHGTIYSVVNTSYPRSKDWGKSFLDEDIEYFNQNISLQLGSTYQITKLFADAMIDKSSGSIINYGSTYGILANNKNIYKRTNIRPGITYNSIKGGVTNLTRAFAAYYGKYNLRINSVCPGGIFNNHNKEFVEDFSKLTPLNRMGNPNEIAETSIFLSSESASYITGQNIIVDGGWTTW